MTFLLCCYLNKVGGSGFDLPVEKSATPIRAFFIDHLGIFALDLLDLFTIVCNIRLLATMSALGVSFVFEQVATPNDTEESYFARSLLVSLIGSATAIALNCLTKVFVNMCRFGLAPTHLVGYVADCFFIPMILAVMQVSYEYYKFYRDPRRDDEEEDKKGSSPTLVILIYALSTSALILSYCGRMLMDKLFKSPGQDHDAEDDNSIHTAHGTGMCLAGLIPSVLVAVIYFESDQVAIRYSISLVAACLALVSCWLACSISCVFLYNYICQVRDAERRDQNAGLGSEQKQLQVQLEEIREKG